MSAIPQHIMEEARALVAIETFPDEESAAVGVARAILAAEQRGAERERERCARVAASFDHRTDIFKILGFGVAAAIRQGGEPA